MAVSLDGGDFWLPPEFLTDDDLAMDKNGNHKNEGNGFGMDAETMRALSPSDFPYRFGSFGTSSDLSSPVESVLGSSETESDEEDFLAGLTRQIARTTLADNSINADHVFASENAKAWVVSGSPQSTLCALGSGCGCKQGSSHESPNGPSLSSSPPATWDLLYAAAGEIARMRMNEDSYGLNHGRGLLGPVRKPGPVTVPVKNNPNVDAGFVPHQSLSYQQYEMQASQFQQLRQQQMMRQQGSAVLGAQAKGTGRYQQRPATQQMVQNRGRNEYVGTRNSRPLGLSPSAWPPLQHAQQQQQQQQPHQQNGSGMRAVFLGTPAGKRECAGTGVFLPRRVDSQSESRRKPACSTVLVPARVVQALNLNLDEMMGAQPQLQRRFSGTLTPDGDASLRLRSNAFPHQKRTARPQSEINHEIRLPQEWTY